MTALETILSHISSARLAGARTIQFTVPASFAADLQFEFAQRDDITAEPPAPPRRASRLKAREPDHPTPVMYIQGCPIFIGETDGISYSWKP